MDDFNSEPLINEIFWPCYPG